MNKFLMLHTAEEDAEIIIRKDMILDVTETEKGSYIDTGKVIYHVKERPHTIFAKLEEPDAIITTDGRVYK